MRLILSMLMFVEVAVGLVWAVREWVAGRVAAAPIHPPTPTSTPLIVVVCCSPHPLLHSGEGELAELIRERGVDVIDVLVTPPVVIHAEPFITASLSAQARGTLHESLHSDA